MRFQPCHEMMNKKNILITGPPGIGKTTLIKNLSEALKDLHPSGFTSGEIRKKGIRKGFELVSLGGKKGILAHVDIRSSFRVGKYGVDIHGFEGFLAAIPLHDTAIDLIIIDEIGKMECFSRTFTNMIRTILDSDKVVIASVALKGSGFIQEVKGRADITLIEITHRNRDSLCNEITRIVREIVPSRDRSRSDA